MIKYRHFCGEYLAWFKTGDRQMVNNHFFTSLYPECLEIRNLKALDSRNSESERTGDFLWFPRLRAKKKGFFSSLHPQKGVEVVVLAGGDIAFSEDLEQVILKGQSGNRLHQESAVRQARHLSDPGEYRIMEGRIFFSLPMEEQPELPSAESTAPLTFTEKTAPVPDSVMPAPEKTRVEIPDLIQQAQPLSYLPTSGTLLATAGGCFRLYLKLLKWSVYLSLMFGLLGWLASLIGDQNRPGPEPEESENVQTDPPQLNPRQDTMAAMPWDYLSRHQIRWNDFISHSYLASYQTSSLEFTRSNALHAPFVHPQVSSAMQYWNAVYTEFFRKDLPKLDSITDFFRNEQIRKNLNSSETAEMVVTFIQEIPYCLIHEGSCKNAAASDAFMFEYHASGKPCLPDIIAGVNSPYEFLHSLKGDCDTRSLLGFTILTRLGIPASVWVSEIYGHSILGAGVGSGGSYYKIVGGIRHSAVELTAKGFRLGMISPEHGDMNNWEIALYKNE
jgi:hypothetical protein